MTTDTMDNVISLSDRRAAKVAAEETAKLAALAPPPTPQDAIEAADEAAFDKAYAALMVAMRGTDHANCHYVLCKAAARLWTASERCRADWEDKKGPQVVFDVPWLKKHLEGDQGTTATAG
jgi:hypothetical protein